MKATVFLGKAVKMLAKRTDTIMVSFEDAIPRIQKAKRVVLTGTPTKILEKDPNLSEKIALKEKYKLNPAKPTVLAFGGSQGAKAINDTIIELAESKLNKSYQILLACGQKQYEVVEAELKEKGLNINSLDGIQIVPYIYELQEVMSASEVLVCRSGAMTIVEIANLGKPSILIPLPNVSHDHQQYNAEVLEKLGAAKIVKNNELNANILHENIMQILNKDNLERMGEKARKVAIKNVEDNIYKEIKRLTSGGAKL